MRVKITEPVMVRGKGSKPGDVHDLTETEALNIISNGRGEKFEGEDKPVETRDPKGK